LRQDVALHQVEQEELARHYRSELSKLEQSGDQSLELEFTRAELAREEKVFEMIAGRVMALRTELRAPGRVTLMREADVPTAPVESIPLKHMALAIAACCCIPLGATLSREFILRRISDPRQLEQRLPLALVAEIATLSRNSTRKNRGPHCTATLFEESVNSLRTRLMFASPNRQRVKVLAITSAIKGEGKTSLAAQLAASVARANGRTLLIDGDMRSPDIHRIFEVKKSPGLAEVLSGEATIDEAIVRDNQTNLGDAGAGVLCRRDDLVRDAWPKS
jgi:hypothetical protein